MSIDPPFASDWVFVIDTEDYAGNFEREMAAHITGLMGECGVGEEAGSAARKELQENARGWFNGHVVFIPDEYGCARPTTIWPTPGWWILGMGGSFRDGHDAADAKAQHEEAARKYAKEIEMTYADKAHGKREAEAFLEKSLSSPLTRYPAFQSVAIFLDAQPPPEILDLMQQRAKTYTPIRMARFGGKAPTITGFRLLQTTRKTVEVPI